MAYIEDDPFNMLRPSSEVEIAGQLIDEYFRISSSIATPVSSEIGEALKNMSAIMNYIPSAIEESLEIAEQILSQRSSWDDLCDLSQNLTSALANFRAFDTLPLLFEDNYFNAMQPSLYYKESNEIISMIQTLNRRCYLGDDCRKNKHDYVIFDESAINEYEIPDTIAIPLGFGRIRMKTSDFISVLLTVISIVVTIFTTVMSRPTSPTEAEQKQIEIQEFQNQLLQSQNQMLSQLLSNIDLSSSSQAEALQALKESVEAQKSAIFDLKESLGSLQQSIDNMKSSENTASEDK